MFTHRMLFYIRFRSRYIAHVAKPKAKRKPATVNAQGATPNAQGPAVDRQHPAIVKKELRQLFRDAFDELGGVEWLVAFARADDQNARTFVQAVARLIPLELTGKDGSPLTVVIQKADGTQVPLQAPPIEGEVRVIN